MQLVALATLALITGCSMCARAAAPPPGKAEIRASFRGYVDRFVQDDGRVVDHAGGGVTTSEGQSYAMLRAVWSNDRDTFEKTRAWMRQNLQGDDPHKLPAWRWGQGSDGEWGVLDQNPASDADIFTAYALYLGADKWKDKDMAAQAKGLLDQVWEHEVTQVDGHLVLLPGPWATGRSLVKVNPSYYLPFMFRLFAEVDSEHPWGTFVDDSYWMFEHVINDQGLFPDWVWLDAESGQIVPPPDGETEQAEYGFEAMRIPWALAADVKWYDEPRAKALLERMDGLRERWERSGGLPAVINPDGSPGRDYEYLGMYGALLPAWDVVSPESAQQLYQSEIHALRSEHGWGDPNDYYAHNWVWFGLALWSDKTGRGPTPIGRFKGKM